MLSNVAENGAQNKWVVLFILTSIYTVNWADRAVLSLLNEAIKSEFAVSDTLIGLLGGLSFSLFYTVMGLPLARIADVWNRKMLLICSIIAWSVMCVLCGLAPTFWILLLARIGVAIGEAGATPASHSILSDRFAPKLRGTALSIFSVGIYLGHLVAFTYGGWLNDFAGWRWTFILIGAPGLLVALVCATFLKEPVRENAETTGSIPKRIPYRRAISELFSKTKSYRYMAFANGFNSFAGAGVGLWLPSFLIRSHGLTTAEIGLWLAVCFVGGAALGTFSGGILSDRFASRDARFTPISCAISASLITPFALFAFFYGDYRFALISYFFAAYFGSFYLGPAFAMGQNLASPQLRAVATSFLLLIGSLIGSGLGPQFVGIVSDILNTRTTLGNDSLRWSMAFVQVFNLMAVVLYLKAAKYYLVDLKRVSSEA